MFERLFVLHDRPGPQGPAYLAALGAAMPVSSLRWGEESALADVPDRPWLIDFETLSPSKAKFLRSKRDEGEGAPRLFVVAPRDRGAAVQARALGATGIIDRPVDPIHLCRMLVSLGRASDRAATTRPDASPRPPGAAAPPDDIDARMAFAALMQVSTVLDDLFDACAAGSMPRADILDAATRNVLSAIGRIGLDPWLALVRRHHSGTYLHSMITMTLAVVFGRVLRVGPDDELRLAMAGLVHDIGKCWVPEDILTKPGPLTADEFAIVRRHSRDGWAALRPSIPPLDAGVLDAVLHHHEFLDGSGYPDGLLATRIPLITRMITITDIYAALAETRSYRPALKPAQIRPILDRHAVQGRIDTELWAAFPLVAAG